jgi:acyl transferase domain-containing protein/thioesterase domain-containing protein
MLGKIAVVGMAGRYPQAWNLAEFWKNLVEGRECITFFADDELREAGVSGELLSRPDYVKAQGVCPGTFLFDASFFSYTPREAEFLDPQHRVFLECAWEALEDAGCDASTYPGRIGLFAGSGATQYLSQLLSIPGIHKLADLFSLVTYNEKDFLATRVGYKLNLRGPCITLQTACSTSLVSIVMACQSLLSFQCDIAMGGGVTLITQERGYLYQEGGIHSPDGHCRAFDAEARGIVGGAGAGIVVLKRLEDALAERDTIRAVIVGTGLNNDGSARVGYSAPGVNGQVAVSSDAIAMAGVNPETIEYVECHGTATPMGDPIEIAALTRSFRAYTEKKNFCAVGSVKTNIGHTDAAAGVAGFTKAVLSLQNALIPPSLHFQKPNPDIDFANSPFYVNAKLKEWKRNGSPRRAGVSSFGLGGTNAHIVLEEAPEQEPSSATRPWNLLVWSAKTESAADKMNANLIEHLEKHPGDSFGDVAYTLQTGRKLFPQRRALVCRDPQDAISALATASTDRLLAGYREQEPGPVAFLFPGQGPQYINMGQQLYENERIFREQIDECAEILLSHLDVGLRDILYPVPGKTDQAAVLLDQIKYTTPILFSVEYAVAKLWLEWGLQPAGMIGHSTGEYAAACIAGVFSLEDALRLVAARGRLMQQAPEGCMTTVLLPEEELTPLLTEVGRISVAAINSPSACVVSGCEPAMIELERRLAEKGVLHRRLHISCAAHSEMMDPILDDFRKELEKTRFNPPSIRYISCVSGDWIKPEEATDPDYWVRHIRQTVRFSEGAGHLLKEPGSILLEVGPGRMLTSLIAKHPQRTAEHVPLSSLPHPKEDQQSGLEFLLSTAGRLWLEGVAIRWEALHDGENPRRVPLPTYPFERQHYQLTSGRGSRKPVQDTSSIHVVPSNHEPARADAAPPSPLLAARHARPKLPTPYVAPRNDVERAIEGIWQDSLGIQSPGVTDSFVSLGGHSLLAIQIAARIRDLFEIEFSVAKLYQTPTIAGLAAVVANEMKKRKTNALTPPADVAERKSSPLVPIREEGKHPPLFLIHPVGGGVIAYHDLAKYLSKEQPVYALQNHDEEHPSLTIEDMAARYTTAIRSMHPDGPYLLGGSSMGGAVAYEMAVQLSGQGHEVSLVAMLDTPSRVVPHMQGLEAYPALTVELNLMSSIIASGQGKEFRMQLSELSRLGPEEQLDCVLRKLKEQQLVSANVSAAALRDALTTFTKNLNALERYRPRNYGGQVLMLRATEVSQNMKETAPDLCDDPAFGWQAYCTQPVAVHWVPGDHTRMNMEPNVNVAGAELQRSIDEALEARVAQRDGRSSAAASG